MSSDQKPGDIAGAQEHGEPALQRIHNCGNCAFAAALALPDNAPQQARDAIRDMRECHAGPPNVNAFLGPGPLPTSPPQVITSTNFPRVRIDNWCGMHKGAGFGKLS